jgi:hypothetical protein
MAAPSLVTLNCMQNLFLKMFYNFGKDDNSGAVRFRIVLEYVE